MLSPKKAWRSLCVERKNNVLTYVCKFIHVYTATHCNALQRTLHGGVYLFERDPCAWALVQMTREFKTNVVHYFSKSDNQSNHHLWALHVHSVLIYADFGTGTKCRAPCICIKVLQHGAAGCSMLQHVVAYSAQSPVPHVAPFAYRWRRPIGCHIFTGQFGKRAL